MRRLLGLLALVICSCNSPLNSELNDRPRHVRIPQGFKPIQYPEGNEPTELRVLLGRKLFYDTRLSATNEISCGSCHILSAAFTDGRSTSTGIFHRSGKRNAPTLANVAWAPRFMSEGGVPNLEAQVFGPMLDSVEMGTDMMEAVKKLNRDSDLRKLAKAAYDRDSIDPFVITRALANFERTIISADSYYDRYKNGKKDELNESQLRGMNLFFSNKTLCSSCHIGNNFTDYSFYNIGLYEEYTDLGRELATGDKGDIGRFKTPTLRNIALTAPYMHDGSMSTLDEVIEHYNLGGKNHPNKDARIKPLKLTTEEKEDLIAFLESLTDYNFVQNKDLLPLNQ